MHARMKRFVMLFIALTLISFASAQSPAPPTAAPSDLDAYVASSMKTFGVPGMAVAIVKDGKIVVAKART